MRGINKMFPLTDSMWLCAEALLTGAISYRSDMCHEAGMITLHNQYLSFLTTQIGDAILQTFFIHVNLPPVFYELANVLHLLP